MNKYPNIKSLRLQNSYKQEYVADVLGVSQPEYSKIENGMRRIDAFMITELCKLYDVKMEDLLKRDFARHQQIMLSEPEMHQNSSAQPLSTELFSRLMDNYSVLVENYLKQQQTNERIINRLFEQRA